MYKITQEQKKLIEESFTLLDSMEFKGYQNVLIAQNIFMRLRSFLQEVENQKENIIIDNTKEA
jgi:hypothetical protein